MKQILKNITIVISAFYFTLAGTGFNIVNYCCSGCENERFSSFVSHSCNDVHTTTPSTCCSSNTTPLTFHSLLPKDFCGVYKTCEVTRMKTDIFSRGQKINSSESIPSVLEILLPTYIGIPVSSFLTVLVQPDVPPDILSISGREILEKISVLII